MTLHASLIVVIHKNSFRAGESQASYHRNRESEANENICEVWVPFTSLSKSSDVSAGKAFHKEKEKWEMEEEKLISLQASLLFPLPHSNATVATHAIAILKEAVSYLPFCTYVCSTLKHFTKEPFAQVPDILHMIQRVLL